MGFCLIGFAILEQGAAPQRGQSKCFRLSLFTVMSGGAYIIIPGFVSSLFSGTIWSRELHLGAVRSQSACCVIVYLYLGVVTYYHSLIASFVFVCWRGTSAS